MQLCGFHLLWDSQWAKFFRMFSTEQKKIICDIKMREAQGEKWKPARLCRISSDRRGETPAASSLPPHRDQSSATRTAGSMPTPTLSSLSHTHACRAFPGQKFGECISLLFAYASLYTAGGKRDIKGGKNSIGALNARWGEPSHRAVCLLNNWNPI